MYMHTRTDSHIPHGTYKYTKKYVLRTRKIRVTTKHAAVTHTHTHTTYTRRTNACTQIHAYT